MGKEESGRSAGVIVLGIWSVTARDASWWTNELREMRKKVRKTYNKVKGTRYWARYTTELKNYNILIQKTKAEHWRKFCEELEGVPETARLHRLLAKDKSNGVGMLKKSDGTFTTDREEVLDQLLLTHFPGSVTTTQPQDEYIPYSDRKRAQAISGHIFSQKR